MGGTVQSHVYVGIVTLVALLVYFWMAMKRVYNRGWILTTVKAIGIVFVYSLILTASLSLALLQALSEL